MFNNLHELITEMPDDKRCREYLAAIRWEGKTVCPYCQHDKCYNIEGGKRYKCASKTCYKKFSVTVGTIFEASNIPLNKWFMAVYLCTAHKKGISSYQLGRDIGVSQKTGWFMLHRIREMMKEKEVIVLGKKDIVEIDETWVGGKIGNKSNKVRNSMSNSEKKDYHNTKTGVVAMVERKANITMRVFDNKPHEVEKIVRQHLDFASKVVTDTSSYYRNLDNEHHHYEINHGLKEFKRGEFHTNTVEGAFSLLKRGIIGIYHQISPKHLQRYCDEFCFRYNSRKIKDSNRFIVSLHRVGGRLTYKKLIDKKEETSNK